MPSDTLGLERGVALFFRVPRGRGENRFFFIMGGWIWRNVGGDKTLVLGGFPAIFHSDNVGFCVSGVTMPLDIVFKTAADLV